MGSWPQTCCGYSSTIGLSFMKSPRRAKTGYGRQWNRARWMKTQRQNRAGLNFQRPAEALCLFEGGVGVGGIAHPAEKQGSCWQTNCRWTRKIYGQGSLGSRVTYPNPVRGEAPVAELGSSAMEKTGGKCWHAREPEAAELWELAERGSFSLSAECKVCCQGQNGVRLGQRFVLGVLGESWKHIPKSPESQGYQRKGSMDSCPGFHPTAPLTTRS